MNRAAHSARRGAAVLTASLFLLQIAGPPAAQGYVLGYTVADMRQPVAQSGGSACPRLNRFNVALAGVVDRRWSTSLNTNPVTILTQDQTPAGRLDEIESVIRDSFSVWTSVSGTALTSSALSPLNRTATQAACSMTDGLNTICLNQNDAGFTTGVLAFTRVVTSDVIGPQPFPNNPPSSFIGEILDADILLRPNDGSIAFATPAALPNQPAAYDLESVLTHELGHMFGFHHSGVWRAVMYPFVPTRGQYLGDRPTPQAPDAPLADDDRSGLRVLYPDPADTVHVGTISGRILPANPLSLAAQPGVSGIFGAHVVAVDNATGAVVAAALAGWSCSDPGPAQFDGSYILERLPVSPNQSYKIYVEPVDGPLDAGELSAVVAPLCRNGLTDPGWPAQFACRVPAVNTNFTTLVRPGP